MRTLFQKRGRNRIKITAGIGRVSQKVQDFLAIDWSERRKTWRGEWRSSVRRAR
jgi:hypothetical protein